MKSRFPCNMALLYCSWVCFEWSWCCFHVSRLVNPMLRMWPRALDEQFTLRLAISQIISLHTPTSANSISTHDDNSSRCIHSTMRSVFVFKDPHGLVWPMIVTMQKWFTIFNVLIQDRQYLAVQLSREGYASLRLWFLPFVIRLQ